VQDAFDNETFRREAVRAIDRLVSYLDEIERRPVLPPVSPGALRAALPATAPEEPEPIGRAIDDVFETIVPGLTHWNHPGFFAYFASSASAPGILGELLAAAFNSNAMIWRTGPAATELERVTLDWLRQAIGLPEPRFGVIHDTASTSTLVALAAARGVVSEWDVRVKGLAGGPRLRLYASQEAHSSVEKAAIVLGIGQEGVARVPVDAEFRMRPEALETAIEADRRAGWRPFAVVATVGTTSTTSIDPVPAIAAIAERHKLWLHVDAAYAGSAAIEPSLRFLMDGVDRADSLVINPHKWMFVPVDLSVLYTRRPEAVRAAFSLVPDYLQTAEHPEAPNLMDYGVALGRRFRALKLWLVLRTFGRRGLADRIREHVRLAGLFRSWVEADPRFEVVAPQPLSVVCFRLRDEARPAEAADARNQALIDAVNATGEVFLSHTKLHGRLVLRLAVGSLRTEERHVRRAWDLLQARAG
jgi:aromatic-L-amino-acid/L-tryptophan decarboxylase